MTEISFASSFKRAYKQKIGNDPQRKARFLSKLAAFQNDPFDPRLRTHKLSGRLSHLWSFSVEYDLRIIFYFASKDKTVLVDIGTHDEVY